MHLAACLYISYNKSITASLLAAAFAVCTVRQVTSPVTCIWRCRCWLLPQSWRHVLSPDWHLSRARQHGWLFSDLCITHIWTFDSTPCLKKLCKIVFFSFLFNLCATCESQVRRHYIPIAIPRYLYGMRNLQLLQAVFTFGEQ